MEKKIIRFFSSSWIKRIAEVSDYSISLKFKIMKEDLILKQINFSKLSFQSKANILMKGRPIQDQKNLLYTTRRKKVNCFFRNEWYTRKE